MLNRLKELKEKKAVHIAIICIIIILAITIAGIIMLKYYVEGEKSLPFQLSKIIVVSSASGTNIEDPNAKWNLQVDQNNDIYISIQKNLEHQSSEVIKSIKIDNITVSKNDETIGETKIYRPAAEGLYKKEDQYIIQNSVKYQGNKESNLGDLKIANQGGNILFRVSNQNVATYQTNDEQINHDGTLLAKSNITKEQIKSNLSFDIIIETGRGIKYKGTVSFELPVGDILTEGTSTIEKTDFSDIIFKRI